MRRTDVIILVAISLTALWRWGTTVASPTVLPDEQVYVDAARHLEAGRSPYDEPIYFYPPTVAVVVRGLTPHLGEVGALRLLRAASLAGIIVVLLLALGTVCWPWYVRLSLGVAFVALSPAVRLATGLGNVAGLATGLVLLALVSWERRPVSAGLALGLGLAVKPVAPLAPILLLLHRPVQARNQPWIAALTGAAAGIGACVGGLRFLPDLLANANHPTNPYNFSLRKVLAELGFDASGLLLLLLVAAVAVVVVRRRQFDRQELLIVAITASLLALPILWAHSMLLLLPIQLLVIDRCYVALRVSRPLIGTERLGVVLAILAVISTLLSHAVGTTHQLPDWASAFVRLIPLLSTFFLGWFALRPQQPHPVPIDC